MTFRTLVLAGCCATLLAPAAMAQAKPAAPPAAAAAPIASPTVTGPSKIGFINIQEAIASTEEGKKMAADLKSRFSPKQTDLENQQKAIDALQKRLQDGGNTMSQAAKDDLTRQIQSKQRDFQQDVQNFQSDTQSAESDAMNTIGQKMLPLLKKYADDHGYTAIVDISLGWPQQSVLYFNPGTVITGDMVKIYDQAHPLAASSTTGGNR
jgi:outer membrane protein